MLTSKSGESWKSEICMDLRFEMPGEITNWSIKKSGSSSFSSATHGWGGQSQMGLQKLNTKTILPKLTMKIPTRILDTSNDGSLNFQAMLDINMSHIKMVFLLIRFDFERTLVYF